MFVLILCKQVLSQLLSVEQMLHKAQHLISHPQSEMTLLVTHAHCGLLVSLGDLWTDLKMCEVSGSPCLHLVVCFASISFSVCFCLKTSKVTVSRVHSLTSVLFLLFRSLLFCFSQQPDLSATSSESLDYFRYFYPSRYLKNNFTSVSQFLMSFLVCLSFLI